jgi:hypothetical protein
MEKIIAKVTITLKTILHSQFLLGTNVTRSKTIVAFEGTFINAVTQQGVGARGGG